MGRQLARIDGDADIGAAVDLGRRRAQTELIESDAVGGICGFADGGDGGALRLRAATTWALPSRRAAAPYSRHLGKQQAGTPPTRMALSYRRGPWRCALNRATRLPVTSAGEPITTCRASNAGGRPRRTFRRGLTPVLELDLRPVAGSARADGEGGREFGSRQAALGQRHGHVARHQRRNGGDARVWIERRIRRRWQCCGRIVRLSPT